MIILDYKDRRPIYEQVAEKLEELMLLGILGENEPLPSVRSWLWSCRSIPTRSRGPMRSWNVRDIFIQ